MTRTVIRAPVKEIAPIVSCRTARFRVEATIASSPSRAGMTPIGGGWPGSWSWRIRPRPSSTLSRLVAPGPTRSSRSSRSWTAHQDPSTVAETLQGVGVEAVPVADFVDVIADEQLLHRGHFVTLEHACMGPCCYERNGFRLSDADSGYERASPLLGENNEWVLGEILGLDAAEQARLGDEGVLE